MQKILSPTSKLLPKACQEARYVRMLSIVRRVAVLFVVLLLCWSLIPGGFELAENVYHLAAHGDFAHQPARSGHLPFNPEHGCGGGFHLCSCCHFQPSLTAHAVALPSASLAGAPHSRDGFLHFACGFPASPEEPPRA